MATYYGYQEREDPSKSMIDWAGITKEITDGLYAENKRREEEKFTLDQNYIKQLNELNNYSQGLNPSVNQAMLGYVQNYRDYLLQNHKLMKQGIISVNDSKLAKQGAQDSFNNLNNVVKGVNGKLEELQKAGGQLNDDQMKDLAALMEFKDQQLLIDPKSGMASLARRNEDGTVDKNSIVPVGAAYQMFTPYEQKSVNDMVQGQIKGLGQWTTAASAYESISDLRDNPEYKDWEDNTINVMMSDPRTTASLGASLDLLDTGELVKKNNAGVVTYELTPEGETKVKEALRQAIEVRISREVKKTEPSQAAINAGKTDSDRKKSFETLANWLETGDENIGAGLINAAAADVKGLVIEGNNLVVVRKDGSKGVAVKAYDDEGNALDMETVLIGIGADLTGLGADDVAKLAAKYKGKSVSSLLKNVEKSTEFKITSKDASELDLLANNKAINRITDTAEPIAPEDAASRMGNKLKSLAISQAKDVTINVDGTNIQIGDKTFPYTDLTGITNAIRNYTGKTTTPKPPKPPEEEDGDNNNFG